MDFVLPPPINWNCSGALDGDGSGMLCYASRYGVYLMDLSESINTCPTLVALHCDRVNSVSIRHIVRKGERSWTLCSGSSDGMVKVTRISNNKDLSLLAEHKKHKSGVLTVRCSTSTENLIASGDEKGCLSVWNYFSNEFIFWNARHCDGAILCLTFAPGNCDIIAIGMKKALMIMKIENKLLVPVHRLLDHNDEIHNLIWLTPSVEMKPILVSSSKDKTIIVHDPESFKAQKYMTCDGISQKLIHKKWFAVSSFAWSGDGFISTGLNGEMFLWFLRGHKPLRLCGGEIKGHSKTILNVTTWLSKQRIKMALSVSVDRTIVVWNIDDMKACFSMPYISGQVFSISRSPFCPDLYAIGVGDNSIKIFNNYNASFVCSNADVHYFKYKVTALTWNPENERMLAIGTYDGTVAIVKDVYLKTNHNIEFSSTQHNGLVHSVVWGPTVGKMKGLSLYSTGGMVAYVHNPFCIEKVPANDIQDVIEKFNPGHVKSNITAMNFSSCNDFVVLGHGNGTIDVYEVTSLTKICSIIHCKKVINCISWHPSSTSIQSSCPRPFSNLMAVASNDNDVHVFDLKNIIDQWRASPSSPSLTLSECLFTLEGHQHRVTKVAWSPRQSELLASASHDGTVQVWNVMEGKGVANYRGHHGQVSCVTWGGSGEVLYSGGDDFTLRGWKFDQLKDTLPPKDSNYRLKCLSALIEGSKVSNHVDPSESLQSVLDGNGADDVDDNDDESSPRLANEDVNVENETRKNKRSIRKTRSLFPISSSKENKNKHQNQLECIQLASLLYSGKERNEISLDEDVIHMGCFVNKRNADRMIVQEIQHHIENESHDHQTMLEIFRGSNASHFREVAKKNQLNDYIVSMAMSVSPKLAREMFIAYANQLVESGLYVKASSYLLSAGMTEEAIQLLLNNKLHKEALCIAISRLNFSNPLLCLCFQSAADAYAANGNFEFASKCLIALGKSKEAINMILRRLEPAALGIASSIAMVTGEDELRLTYTCSYVVEQLMACEWVAAEEFLESFTNTEHLLLFVTCHKFLTSLLFKFVPEVVTLLRSNPHHIDMNSLPSMIVSPLECCLKKWRKSGLMEKLNMVDIHKHLLRIHYTRQSINNSQNVLVDISLQIAIFITEQLMQLTTENQLFPSNDESNHWLLDALIKIEGLDNNQSKFCFHFANILFPSDDNNINKHVKSLQTLFLEAKKNDDVTFRDYFYDSKEFIAMPVGVESVMQSLDKFSSGSEQKSKKEINISDCILAKCCFYALNVLNENTQKTDYAIDHSHNFKGCPPDDFHHILQRSSDILLNSEAYHVQKITSAVNKINKLCKEMIIKGGCQLPQSGGGDENKVSFFQLATQLQNEKDNLAMYPRIYEHFPDCNKSAQLLIDVADKLLHNSKHEEIVSGVNRWITIHQC